MTSRFTNLLFAVFFSIVALSSCNDRNQKTTIENQIVKQEITKDYVEVVTTGMDFELVDTISAGWTTFKYINNSLEPHFFILEKMPDSLGIEDYKKDLIPPFMEAFKYFEKGDIPSGMKEFEKIPEWFYRLEIAGGVGLTSPKKTTESTIHLEPGKYVMECYVRMPNGMAHVFMGMLKELVVVEKENENIEPKAAYEISLSSETGIVFVDSLKAGKYTMSVYFEDQKKYEHMLGHDVNLVKIAHDSLIVSLGEWLNSSDIKAFRSPASDGLTFLGGVEDLPEKNKGYITTDLKKGSYILISEIPQVLERKMYKTFKVY